MPDFSDKAKGKLPFSVSAAHIFNYPSVDQIKQIFLNYVLRECTEGQKKMHQKS
jgi:hypothetical protein